MKAGSHLMKENASTQMLLQTLRRQRPLGAGLAVHSIESKGAEGTFSFSIGGRKDAE